MKNSSYVLISLFSLLLASVIILPALTDHAAARTEDNQPQITAQTLDDSSEQAVPATSSVETAAASPAAMPAPVKGQSLPEPVTVEKPSASPSAPVRLSIPAVGITAPIVPVGVNAKGEMAVPNGSTNNVGWYAAGVTPGNPGAAVLDAHVFAAFSKLHNVSIGDSVYVKTESGQTLRFIVTATRTSLLSDLTPGMLFEETDARHLNLITCAGKLTPDHSTYDHRLIVYTTLAE
jgi:sortase (surface protein transpeptidase)